MPLKREATHEERAAALLKRIRTSSELPKRNKGGERIDGDEVLPMPRLIHALHTLGGQSVVDAMQTVRNLVKGKCTTRARLSRVSAPELEELGVGGTSATRDKLVRVLQTLGTSSAETEAVGLSHAEKQQREEALRRDWGDAPQRHDEDEGHFAFYPVLEEASLQGRHVVVNRAPVLTAWCVVVLQYMGFAAAEALSLAQCYVSTTATARAQSLGRIAKAPSATVSANQPHIEFMGVTIPVICLRSGRYRGLHGGQIVPPSKAFEYLRKSMFQTLPQVMGAMMLLASSYVDKEWRTSAEDEAEHSAEALHKAAYGLYTEFRPETGGEWGKRGTLYLDHILKLRRTSEAFGWPQGGEEAERVAQEGEKKGGTKEEMPKDEGSQQELGTKAESSEHATAVKQEAPERNHPSASEPQPLEAPVHPTASSNDAPRTAPSPPSPSIKREPT